MQTIHKPPGMQQHMMPGGAASPAADGQPGNRMAQGKPIGMMPPPPPSPATAAKNPPGAPKQEDGGAPPNGRIDASPQNAAAGMPGQNPPSAGTPAPHTPNASGTAQQQQQQQQQMTAPSPSQILGASTPQMANHAPPPQMANHPPPPAPPVPVPAPNPADALDPNAFDFSFGEFDVGGSLMNDSSLNFERDFAAWFDPENAT